MVQPEFKNTFLYEGYLNIGGASNKVEVATKEAFSSMARGVADASYMIVFFYGPNNNRYMIITYQLLNVNKYSIKYQ